MIFLNRIRVKLVMLICIGSLVYCNPQHEKEKQTSEVEAADSQELVKGANRTIDTSALIVKAALLYAKDQYEEAIESYNELLSIDSLNGEYYYKIGYCLAQLHKDSAAIKNYIRATELNFRKFDACRSIGLIYAIGPLKNNSKAIEYLNKCLVINPEANDIKKLIREIKHESNEVML